MSGHESDDGQPFLYTSNPENETEFYYADTRGGASLGRYYHLSETNILSQLPIRNGTPHNISGVSIAFDFVYKPVQVQSEITYRLSYRVNNGRWVSPSGGFFTSDFLQDADDGWSSFSIQIMLDQLYLLPNDHLDIRWEASGAGSDSGFIPVALQKIELFANQAEPKDIHPGALIISEIMPAFDTGSGRLEYVELYNSTEQPINLRGLVLQSGDNRVVVQKDIIAEPYNPIVLTGYPSTGGPFDSFTDYRYVERLLENRSGRLLLSFDGRDVARALFESPKPGTAVQMNSLENAFDGYSSLSHFVPVTQEGTQAISGTPGEIDPESYLYSKIIKQSGWYLLEPPGQLTEALNRDLISGLNSTQLETGSSESGIAQPPYAYYHPTEAEPLRIYASGQGSSATTSEGRNSEKNSIMDDNQLASLKATEQLSVSDITNPDGGQAYPALMTWSDKSQQFELIWREDDVLTPWNSYMSSGGAEVMVSNTKNGSDRDEAWTGLTRLVGLSLASESDPDTDTVAYDRALIGFWNSPSQSRDPNYSLPKLWPPMIQSNQEPRDPMLFFKSVNAAYSANSYLNFPFDPDEPLQISVGLKLPASVKRARFVWDSIDSLPDRWEIEFVDAELGENIDMREKNSYSFSERSDIVRDGIDNPDNSFQSVKPGDYDRFYVRISSTGDLGMFEAENEIAESIELKQNYPNPFNPTTTIGFYVPKATDVRIGVFNVVGQQVGQLIDERLGAGNHTVTWNAMDMPSGVYIVQMEANNTVETRKITLIK